MRRGLALVLGLASLAAPSLASAQVYIAPPPPPPIVYGAPVGAVPPHVYILERVRWHLRRLPRVYVQAGVIPPPPPVMIAPPPPRLYVMPPPVYVTPPPVYVAPRVVQLPPVPPPIIAPAPCCYAPMPQYAPASPT